MSKLDDILNQLFIDEISEAKAKQKIKDLLQDLIDETFTDTDALAYDFWKKVEKL